MAVVIDFDRPVDSQPHNRIAAAADGARDDEIYIAACRHSLSS